MAKQKKESKALNLNIAIKISDQLERFCEETGATKTAVIEKILGAYFDEYFGKPEEERRLFK